MPQVAAPAVTQPKPVVKTVPVSEVAALQAGKSAYSTLRQEWVNARLKGRRDKKAKEDAEKAEKKTEE
jgi:hypothetical protein